MRSILLVFLCLLAGCVAKKRIISVSGHCDIQDRFDRYKVIAIIEHQDMNQAKASSNVEAKNNELINAVKKLGLENLNLVTLAYELQPIREWENHKQVFKGYKAYSSLAIEFSDEKSIGKLLKRLTTLKLDQINGPDRFFSKEKSKALNNKCLVIALEDAKAKAKLMANTLEANIAKVHRIDEKRSPSPDNPRPMYMAKSMRTESAPQIELGVTSFVKDIFVEFELD